MIVKIKKANANENIFREKCYSSLLFKCKCSYRKIKSIQNLSFVIVKFINCLLIFTRISFSLLRSRANLKLLAVQVPNELSAVAALQSNSLDFAAGDGVEMLASIRDHRLRA